MIDNLLPSLPLWLGAFILILLCILSSEAGRFAHGAMTRRGDVTDLPKSEAEGYIIGAIFGLFAFIIGFTFSIAVDRFDERRGWVAEEATAITTLFLRADLLDEPFRSELRSTLRDYAHTRIAPDGLWNETMQRQLEQSRHLRQKLWEEARSGAYPYRDTDLGSYIVEGANDLLTIGTRRELAGTEHIPDRILNSLLLYLIAASATLGYLSTGEAKRVRVASTLLFTLMALAIVLILDLDRPRAGSIKVPQAALVTLVTTLDQVQLHAAPSGQSR
jgi:hypothetical protein